MLRTPFDESESDPMPNQLRTRSSSAVVTPGSMLMVVSLTRLEVPVPPLNVIRYFWVWLDVLAMRMSLRQLESAPVRCPTEGMICAVGDGVERVEGVTGVTRFTETGTEVVGAAASDPTFPETTVEP